MIGLNDVVEMKKFNHLIMYKQKDSKIFMHFGKIEIRQYESSQQAIHILKHVFSRCFASGNFCRGVLQEEFFIGLTKFSLFNR